MTSEIDKAELNEREYNKYRKLIDTRETNDAYRIFEGRPSLVEFLPIGLIASDYLDIKNWVGNKQSETFLKSVVKQIKFQLGSGIKSSDLFARIKEEEDRIWFEQQFGDDSER